MSVAASLFMANIVVAGEHRPGWNRGPGRPAVIVEVGRADRELLEKHVNWMVRRGYANSTIMQRTSTVGRLLALGQLRDITHLQIDEMLHEQRTSDGRPVGPSTRNLSMAHLRSFYRWAVREEYLTVNVADRLENVKAPESLPKAISEDDLARALHAAQGLVMHTWLVLGAYAGLRATEIAKLTGERVDIPGRVILIEMSKGGRSRVVPMHQRIADELAGAPASGRLWRISPNVVSQRVSRHFQALGMPWTAHCLRHRFATRIYEATGDIYAVSNLLGHKSVVTTQIYTKASVSRRRSAVDGLA
jgi:site-specific recombinase XerD